MTTFYNKRYGTITRLATGPLSEKDLEYFSLFNTHNSRKKNPEFKQYQPEITISFNIWINGKMKLNIE